MAAHVRPFEDSVFSNGKPEMREGLLAIHIKRLNVTRAFWAFNVQHSPIYTMARLPPSVRNLCSVLLLRHPAPSEHDKTSFVDDFRAQNPPAIFEHNDIWVSFLARPSRRRIFSVLIINY